MPHSTPFAFVSSIILLVAFSNSKQPASQPTAEAAAATAAETFFGYNTKYHTHLQEAYHDFVHAVIQR